MFSLCQIVVTVALASCGIQHRVKRENAAGSLELPEHPRRAPKGEEGGKAGGGDSVCPELYSEQQWGCVTTLRVLGLTGAALTPL